MVILEKAIGAIVTKIATEMQRAKAESIDKNGRIIFQTGVYIDVLHCFDILATDWEEVEG